MSAGIKWSAFTAGSTLTGADQFVGLESGVNVRWTVTQLTSFLSTSTLAAGTLTTSQPLTLTQTWNAGGVTFNALLVNVTATASAAASTLMDLQVGGSSKLNIGKGAELRLGGASSYLTSDGSQYYFVTPGNGNTVCSLITANFGGAPEAGIGVQAGGFFGFASGTAATGTIDVGLTRDAANTLAQRNSTNAQTFRMYGTFTDASNYERLAISANIGVNFQIDVQRAGTGSSNLDLQINSGSGGGVKLGNAGSSRWSVDGASGGMFLALADNSYDIGASGANRPRTGYFGTSLVSPILERTAPVTETNSTHTLAATTTSLIANRAGTITVTLPSAASFPGREIFIKTIQAQTVISNASNVVPSTSGTAGTAILPATDGAWALLVSDATNWIIMAANPLV